MSARDRLAVGFVGLSAAVFLGIGTWTLVDPIGALAQVGVVATSPGGVLELRAMYGGLELGAGLFLLWCLRDLPRAWTGVMAATLMIGGLGAVRLVGLVTVATAEPLLPVLCAAEVTAGLCGLALLAWRARAASSGSTSG